METMRIYEAARTPPPEALKPIKGGRLSGKSDINPMWRIKTLTELFGPCGIGWKYTIDRRWLEHCEATKETAAFVEISLYIKQGDIWSDAIPGTGGSSFLAKEKNGPYMSDECYKMALTDAISVACKALGVAADVYWENDPTKYDKPDSAHPGAAQGSTDAIPTCTQCGNIVKGIKANGKLVPGVELLEKLGMCYDCYKRLSVDG